MINKTRRKNVMTEFSMLIARVRHLVIGALGELVIFNERIIENDMLVNSQRNDSGR